MMDYLRDQVAVGNGRLDGAGLLQSQATAARRSCLFPRSFLGMLEMVRDREIQLRQDEIFGPILLTRAVEIAGE